MSRPPVHAIRLEFIKASIWLNHSKSGDRHSVTVTRLFRDGSVWRESSRFYRDELLLVGKVLDLAHTWIFEQSVRSVEHSVDT